MRHEFHKAYDSHEERQRVRREPRFIRKAAILLSLGGVVLGLGVLLVVLRMR
jgi:hypothetical protein